MMEVSGELKQLQARMKKSVEHFQQSIQRIRTGRAHTSLLDAVMVEYYGSLTPLQQMASISVQDASTLMVAPWDAASVTPIEKAIVAADLGLNPVTKGMTILIPLPSLNEERRKELGKMVRSEGEKEKVALRNIRRDSIQICKDEFKEKQITQDDLKRLEETIQQITDEHVSQVTKIVLDKEKELMQV